MTTTDNSSSSSSAGGDTIVTRLAGITPGSRLAQIIAKRADIMALTEATHQALLRPREPGGISYAERAALVCRIARLNDENDLAAYYHEQLIALTAAGSAAARMADPLFTGSDADDVRLSALLAHVDLVTRSPKDASPDHISALKQAGITDADIVRLSEIIAFMNYQIRVIAGLRLLGDIA
jgi:CMD domain protein